MPDELQQRLAKLAEVERRLKAEVDDARIKYDRANRRFGVESARAYELGLATVDGAHALRQASKEQTVATEAYGRAVERFCNLILYGKMPVD